jgi:hypothetical protein
MKKIAAAAVIGLSCFASFADHAVARPDGVLTIKGTGSTNSLDLTTTLGSAELTIKGRGKGTATARLTCGILGELQGGYPDGSLAFQHMVACDDHSLFILASRTTISVQGPCVGRPGIIGTFSEESTLTGVDGPYAGATGELRIEGAIECGFNDMTIEGSMERP